MRPVILISAGRRFGQNTRIRQLFENTGVPGYFTITTEIPPELMDSPPPERDYYLVFYNEVPREKLRRHNLRCPTILETLWALGFMNIELAKEIIQKRTRFMHEPFRAHMCPWRGSEPWRQILVRRNERGYAVETVCVKDQSRETQLVYSLDV